MSRGPDAGRSADWGEVGRFVASDRRGAGRRFLFRDLLPPHGRRERWLRTAASRSDVVARWALAPAGAEARRVGAEVERALEAVETGPWTAWVLARPHGDDRRGRLTLFLFPSGAEEPDRVVKLRRSGGEGRDLAGEARALERLAEELPAPLRRTLPPVLHHAPAAGPGAWEALVLSRLPGRSGYVEVQASFNPARHLPRHFRAAGAWLVRFQRATLRHGPPWTPPPWEALAPEPGEPRPPWHRRLEAELQEAPWPRVARHGDFWVRNLLLAPGGVGTLPGVVDWEHHRPAAPPFEDLFHFAWSYALAYPWRGRRRPPAEAFERAFLRDTALSREIRRYLADYALGSGMDAGVLGPLFRVFLLERSGGERGEWIRLYRSLEGAQRCVFSG